MERPVRLLHSLHVALPWAVICILCGAFLCSAEPGCHQTAIATHDLYRAAGSVPALEENERLARSAAEVAKQLASSSNCRATPSTAFRTASLYAESVYLVKPDGSRSRPADICAEAVHAWHQASHSSLESKAYLSSPSTTHVGCAAAHTTACTVVVCHYSPSGPVHTHVTSDANQVAPMVQLDAHTAASTARSQGPPTSQLQPSQQQYSWQQQGDSSRRSLREINLFTHHGHHTHPGHRRGLQQAAQTKGGRVYAWGTMQIGNYVPPEASTNVVQMAVTWWSDRPVYAALLGNGTVVAWGQGQTVYPRNATADVTAISAGQDIMLALLSNGTVVPLTDLPYKWKYFAEGGEDGAIDRLPNGTWTFAGGNGASFIVVFDDNWMRVPPAAADGKVVRIQAWPLCMAWKQNGEVVVWGAVMSSVPPAPADWTSTKNPFNVSLSDITTVVTSSSHLMAALLVNGSVVMGDPSLKVPSEVSSMNITAVAASDDSLGDTFLALSDNGTVVQWTYQTSGPLTAVKASFPIGQGVQAVNISQGHKFDPTSPSNYSFYAVLATNKLVGWDVESEKVVDVPVFAREGAIAVADAGSMALALKSGGLLVAYGGSATAPPTPPADILTGASQVTAIAAGASHALALTIDGKVIAWGDSTYGQADVPTNTISSGGGAAKIAAGAFHSLVVLKTGTVICWGGKPGSGVCPAPPDSTSSGVTKVVAAADHSLALRDGWVIQWGGSASSPQPDVPKGILWGLTSNSGKGPVVDIAAGAGNNVARLSNGTIVQWGSSGNPPSSPPRLGNATVAIAASSYRQGAAVLNNGSVVTWLTDDGGLINWNSNLPSGLYEDAANVVGAAYPNTDDKLNFKMSLLLSNDTVVCLGDGCTDKHVRGVSGVRTIASGNHFDMALEDIPAPTSPAPPGTTPGTPTVVDRQAPGSQTPATVTSSPASKSLSGGAIAGIVIAALVLVAAAVAGVWFVRRQRATPSTSKYAMAVAGGKSATGFTSDGVQPVNAPTPGLTEGAAFSLATAHQYAWVVGATLPGTQQAVEAGINDMQLDSKFTPPAGGMSRDGGAGSGCPVVQLSSQELQQQVQLLSDGLLGKGATAMVFKCRWPSRFGPDALLAIKVLKDGYSPEPVMLQSFAYEAQVLASINHPNVIKLYGYCLESPCVCLILELLPGNSLKDMLYGSSARAALMPSSGITNSATGKEQSTLNCQDSTGPLLLQQANSNMGGYQSTVNYASTSAGSGTGVATSTTAVSSTGASSSLIPLSPSQLLGDQLGSELLASPKPGMPLPQVVRISRDVAAGLAYLHGKGLGVSEEEEEGVAAGGMAGIKSHRIVHRDLKPANIMFNSAGQAKLSDFGLAREHEQTTLATMHLGAGTLPYMAPELLVAAKSGLPMSATNKVDIYSLGMMMWEMMSGQPPWKYLTPPAIITAVLGRRRPVLPGADSQAGAGEEGEEEEAADAAHPHMSINSPGSRQSGQRQLNAIIRACWQQREARRPTASELYDMLSALVRQQGDQ